MCKEKFKVLVRNYSINPSPWSRGGKKLKLSNIGSKNVPWGPQGF